MFDETYKGTWLEDYKNEMDISKEEGNEHWESLYYYYLAVYWTVTTITTVGYGDINSKNNVERMFASFAMILGVIGFSFATGTLSSIIANYDSTNAKHEEKMEFLDKIRDDF
jgi:hypothetical protein